MARIRLKFFETAAWRMRRTRIFVCTSGEFNVVCRKHWIPSRFPPSLLGTRCTGDWRKIVLSNFSRRGVVTRRNYRVNEPSLDACVFGPFVRPVIVLLVSSDSGLIISVVRSLIRVNECLAKIACVTIYRTRSTDTRVCTSFVRVYAKNNGDRTLCLRWRAVVSETF